MRAQVVCFLPCCKGKKPVGVENPEASWEVEEFSQRWLRELPNAWRLLKSGKG